MELESVKKTKIEGITSILNMKLHEGGGWGQDITFFSCLVGSFYGSLQIGSVKTRNPTWVHPNFTI
jgi:hypothetical protein